MREQMLAKGPLHRMDGSLEESGYAFSQLKTFDPRLVKAPARHWRAWNRFLVFSEAAALDLSVLDIGGKRLGRIALVDFDSKEHLTTRWRDKTANQKSGLPPDADRGTARAQSQLYEINLVSQPGARALYGHAYNLKEGGRELLFDIELTDPGLERLATVDACPGKPVHFDYRQTLPCLSAQGRVVWGDRDYLFSPAVSFAVMNWRRAAWPGRETALWGTACGVAAGQTIGLRFIKGMGTGAAEGECCLFVNGKALPPGRLSIDMPKNGLGPPNRLRDGDGRLELAFEPRALIREAGQPLRGLPGWQQAFGRFTGFVRPDGGKELALTGMQGCIELGKL